MKRRQLLQFATAAGLAPWAEAQFADVVLKAGPYSVIAPAEWAKTAIITPVPIFPLYSTKDWAAYQKDKRYSLKPGYCIRPRHWSIAFPVLSLPESPLIPKPPATIRPHHRS